MNAGQVSFSRKDGGQDTKEGFVDNMEESMWVTGVHVPREEQLRDGGELLNHGVIDDNNPDNPRSSYNEAQVRVVVVNPTNENVSGAGSTDCATVGKNPKKRGGGVSHLTFYWDY